MANRELTADQQFYNNNQSVTFFELLYVRTRETGSTTYDYTYLTNAPYNITIAAEYTDDMGLDEPGARTFLAVGPFLQFGNIEESADFNINTLTVSLGGMRPQDLALFLENQYIDQPLKIWRVWFDTDGQQIDAPIQIFSGRIDKPVVSDDPNGQVVVGCAAASQWVDYARTAGRRTNNNEQQFIDRKFYNPAATSGNIDIGFKWAGDTITNLKWGG
jgi:hypothetical protein